MKCNHKLLVAIAAAALTTSLAMGGPAVKGMPFHKVPAMQSHRQPVIKLSSQQKQELQNMSKKLMPQIEAIITNKSLTNAQRRTKLMAVRKERIAAVKKILTPAQWKTIQEERSKAEAQYKAMLKKQHAKERTATPTN